MAFILCVLSALFLAISQGALSASTSCNSKADCPAGHCCDIPRNIVSKRDEAKRILPIPGTCRPYSQEGQRCSRGCGCAPGHICVPSYARYSRAAADDVSSKKRIPDFAFCKRIITEKSFRRPCFIDENCDKGECCIYSPVSIEVASASPPVIPGTCQPYKTEGELCPGS